MSDDEIQVQDTQHLQYISLSAHPLDMDQTTVEAEGNQAELTTQV